jgi:hypothetical protein
MDSGRRLSLLALALFLVPTAAAGGSISTPDVACSHLAFADATVGCLPAFSAGSDVPLVGGVCVWSDGNGVGGDPGHNCRPPL